MCLRNQERRPTSCLRRYERFRIILSMLSSRPFAVTSSKHVMTTTRKLMRTTQLGQTVLARNPKGLACLFPNRSYFSVCKSTFRTNPTQRTHQQRWSHSQKNGNSQEPVKATEKVATTEGAESMTAWQRFLAPKEMPERNTLAWYREMLLLCTVFAITGSGTMVVRHLSFTAALDKH